jgi:hypothetical protein
MSPLATVAWTARRFSLCSTIPPPIMHDYRNARPFCSTIPSTFAQLYPPLLLDYTRHFCSTIPATFARLYPPLLLDYTRHFCSTIPATFARLYPPLFHDYAHPSFSHIKKGSKAWPALWSMSSNSATISGSGPVSGTNQSYLKRHKKVRKYRYRNKCYTVLHMVPAPIKANLSEHSRTVFFSLNTGIHYNVIIQTLTQNHSKAAFHCMSIAHVPYDEKLYEQKKYQ